MSNAVGKTVDHNSVLHSGRLLGIGARFEIAPGEGVGVTPSPINFDSQQLLQPDIGKTDISAEMVQQSELTGLIRGLESKHAQSEGLREAIGEGGVETALTVEQPDTFGGLARFHDQFHSARIQPSTPLIDQFLD